MKTEYEATFTECNVNAFRIKMEQVGAIKKRSEFLQKRVTLHLPQERRQDNVWLRVRDEGDRITLAMKGMFGEGIDGQKELEVNVDSFEDTVLMLEKMGCEAKSFQESKRELWLYDGAEITIDTWPFLEPYIEIEGESEEHVRRVSESVGFDFADAQFCSATEIYKIKYGVSLEELPSDVQKNFTFQIENPFSA